jgi:hypothetical protein
MAIGHYPAEAQRLVRLIYAALGEANGVIIGAWEAGESSRLELARTITARVEEMANYSA